ETVSAILRDDPPAIPGAGPRVTAELAPILRRCLAKPPEGRYASARELADDLRRFRTAADRGDARRPWLGDAVAGGGAAGRARAAPGVGARPPSPGRGTVSGRKALTVLVADFDNATGEDVFDSVLEQAVVIGLESAPFISAYPRTRAQSVAADIDRSAKGLDAGRARLVAQREGIAALVAGRIEKAAPGYRIEVTTLDGVSAKRLASGERTARRKDDVLPAVGELVVRVRQQLGEVIPDAVRAAAWETFTAGSLEAGGLYARAQDQMAAGRWTEAIPLYEAAIRADAAFGRA